MISEGSKKWIEIAKVLADDDTVKLNCPECGFSFLSIINVRFGGGNEHLERHIHCEKCGAMNSLLMRSRK